MKNGYIEFTDEVCKAYFDSFVFAGRNGKYYEDYTMRIPTNLELSNWYNAFYKNNKNSYFHY